MERKRARLRQNDDRCGLDPLEMVTDATIRRQDTRASLYGPVEEHKVAAVCMCAWNSYMIFNTSRIRIHQHNKTTDWSKRKPSGNTDSLNTDAGGHVPLRDMIFKIRSP